MAILTHTRQRHTHKIFTALKQLVPAGFCILFLGQAAAWAGEVYDMKLFWPFPTQKILNFRHYGGDGQPAKGYWGEPVIEHA